MKNLLLIKNLVNNLHLESYLLTELGQQTNSGLITPNLLLIEIKQPLEYWHEKKLLNVKLKHFVSIRGLYVIVI